MTQKSPSSHRAPLSGCFDDTASSRIGRSDPSCATRWRGYESNRRRWRRLGEMAFAWVRVVSRFRLCANLRGTFDSSLFLGPGFGWGRWLALALEGLSRCGWASHG